MWTYIILFKTTHYFIELHGFNIECAHLSLSILLEYHHLDTCLTKHIYKIFNPYGSILLKHERTPINI